MEGCARERGRARVLYDLSERSNLPVLSSRLFGGPVAAYLSSSLAVEWLPGVVKPHERVIALAWFSRPSVDAFPR